MFPRQSVIAHGRCEIRRILLLDNDELLTVGNDSFVRVWDPATLTLKREARMPSQYLVAATALTEGIGVGFTRGSLALLNSELKIQWEVPLHTDLLTDVIEVSGTIASCSLDGSVVFIDAQSRNVLHRLQFDQPLWQLASLSEFVYAAGQPAVRINTLTYEVKELPSYTMFQEHQQKMFGCSIESVRCLANNEPAYLQCSVLLDSKHGLLALTEKCIGVLELRELGFMNWRVVSLEGMPDGYELRCVCEHNNMLYVVGDQGYIYQFDLGEIMHHIQEKVVALQSTAAC